MGGKNRAEVLLNRFNSEKLHCDATLNRLIADKDLEKWQAASSWQKQGKGQRCLFVERRLVNKISELDDDLERPDRYIRSENNGSLSSAERVEKFLNAYVSGQNIEILKDIGQKPPFKKIQHAGLHVWEVRLTQVRVFGWSPVKGTFVLLYIDWTDFVHANQKETPIQGRSFESYAEAVNKWRVDHGYEKDIWKGKFSREQEEFDAHPFLHVF